MASILGAPEIWRVVGVVLVRSHGDDLEGDEFKRFFESVRDAERLFRRERECDFVGTARVWVRRGGVLERRECSGYFE